MPVQLHRSYGYAKNNDNYIGNVDSSNIQRHRLENKLFIKKNLGLSNSILNFDLHQSSWFYIAALCFYAFFAW